MNKSEIAERYAREIHDRFAGGCVPEKCDLVIDIQAIVERAIAESRGQPETPQPCRRCKTNHPGKDCHLTAELGDGEPSSAPPNVQTPADWIEVRRGFGSIDLFEDLRNGEFVTASGMNDGGFIVWRKVRSGAAQEVSPPSPEPKKESKQMNDDQIKHMVNRFLIWRLPENFNPDGGISFKRTFNEHTACPMKHEPVGTNLLDATQAKEMIRYLIDGMPEGDTRELKAALKALVDKLKVILPKVDGFISLASLRAGQDLYDGPNIAEELKVAKRLLGEPTKE